MKVFVCEDQITDMATGIYDAWVWGMAHGHDQVSLKKAPVEQMSFLDEYCYVEPDSEKAEKVLRSIGKKISWEAYVAVFYGMLYEKDVLNTIYQFLRVGFRAGKSVMKRLQEPVVMEMMEIWRRVGNERHYFREFTRFDDWNGILIGHIEPKNNVVYLVSEHFADRMPSENWMLIDDRRRLAVVHSVDQESYLRTLTEEEWRQLQKSEQKRDSYSELWNTFFRTITIKERENPNCQRNHFPLWMRKHATEFRQA